MSDLPTRTIDGSTFTSKALQKARADRERLEAENARLRERNAVLTVRSNATEVENRNLRRLVEDYLAGHGRWANGHECLCPLCERARSVLGKPKQENLPL
jgi:hypothetical protein